MSKLVGFYTDEDGKVRPITKGKGKRAAKRSMQAIRLTSEQAVVATATMQKRSPKAIEMDLKRLAKIAPSFEAWLKAPNRYDLPDIDTPDVKEQAQAIKETLQEKPVVVITDEQQQPQAEFQILPKAEASTVHEEKRRGRTPDREAILAKAIELYQKEQAIRGLPAITPEEHELKEAGYWEQARDLLMYSAPRIVDEQVMAYIDSLRAELEQMGYTIVPIES